jgi:hypothetical protein
MNVNQTQFSDADFLNSTGISKYRTITDGNSNNYTVKLDYTLPFSEKTKLEAGLMAHLDCRTMNLIKIII